MRLDTKDLGCWHVQTEQLLSQNLASLPLFLDFLRGFRVLVATALNGHGLEALVCVPVRLDQLQVALALLRALVATERRFHIIDGCFEVDTHACNLVRNRLTLDGSLVAFEYHKRLFPRLLSVVILEPVITRKEHVEEEDLLNTYQNKQYLNPPDPVLGSGT